MTLISNGPQAPNVTRKDLISKKEDVQINALRYILYDSYFSYQKFLSGTCTKVTQTIRRIKTRRSS